MHVTFRTFLRSSSVPACEPGLRAPPRSPMRPGAPWKWLDVAKKKAKPVRQRSDEGSLPPSSWSLGTSGRGPSAPGSAFETNRRRLAGWASLMTRLQTSSKPKQPKSKVHRSQRRFLSNPQNPSLSAPTSSAGQHLDRIQLLGLPGQTQSQLCVVQRAVLAAWDGRTASGPDGPHEVERRDSVERIRRGSKRRMSSCLIRTGWNPGNKARPP